MDEKRWLSRRNMLAAEVFGYSYDHYEEHIGIGHARFEYMMPGDVDILEQAEEEGWDEEQIADALDIPLDKVPSFQRSFREAREIVDAPNLAEAFRRGVRFSIQHAVQEGLEDEGSIERLVTQIGYRAADLGFRLDMGASRLSTYSDLLRTETEHDQAYFEEQMRRASEERLDQEQEEDE